MELAAIDAARNSGRIFETACHSDDNLRLSSEIMSAQPIRASSNCSARRRDVVFVAPSTSKAIADKVPVEHERDEKDQARNFECALDSLRNRPARVVAAPGKYNQQDDGRERGNGPH